MTSSVVTQNLTFNPALPKILELITKESLRVFGFGHTEIDSKELVKFIADLLTDVKNFRNAREAGEPMTDEIKHWMDDVNVEDFPSN